MPRRPIAALAALIVLIPALLAGVAQAEGRQWHRASTPHFVYYSSADSDDLLHAARELERMAEVIALWGLGSDAQARPRVVLIALPDKKRWKPHLPKVDGKRQDLAGYVFDTRFGYWIGFAEYDRRGRALAYHEYSHTLVSETFRAAPLCLNEGLAEYLSTFAAEGSKVSFGDELAWHSYTVKHENLFKAGTLFAIDPSSATYRSRVKGQQVFYAESWALVHYLMKKRSDSLFEFAGAISDGMAAREAFHSVYPGESWDRLPERIRDYVADGDLRGREISFRSPFEELEIEVEPVGQAEVDAQLAYWRSRGDDIDEELTEELLDGAEDDPAAAALVHAVRGTIAMRRFDTDAALAAFRAAAAAPAGPVVDAIALSIAGAGLLELASLDDSRQKELLEEAVGLLTRSLAIDPSDARCLDTYQKARSFLDMHRSSERSVARREKVKSNRGRLLAVGKLRAGSEAMQKRDFDAAIRWFTEARDRSGDDEELRGKAEEALAEAHAGKHYHEGLEALKRDDMERALECFEKAAELTSIEELRSGAEDYAAELRKILSER